MIEMFSEGVWVSRVGLHMRSDKDLHSEPANGVCDGGQETDEAPRSRHSRLQDLEGLLPVEQSEPLLLVKLSWSFKFARLGSAIPHYNLVFILSPAYVENNDPGLAPPTLSVLP